MKMTTFKPDTPKAWVLAVNLGFCLAAAFTAFSIPALSATQSREEQRLLEVLKSSASLQEKDAACAELKRVGTAQSVPALAELLADEALSHSARYALESLSGPEAGLALIEALDRTSGLVKAGIIHSLGRRRETQAIPVISNLLDASDPAVARAAATALGSIGGVSATQPLFSALSGKLEPELRGTILGALLAAANMELEEGDRNRAFAVFEKLFRVPEPNHVRGAAYRGLIAAADPEHSLRLLKAGLRDDDRTVQLVSLQMSALVSSPHTTEVLCELLPKAAPPTQVALIEALRQRGDKKASQLLIAMAKSPDPAVRVAVLGGLGDLGDAAAVAVLLEAAASANETQKKAARQSLLNLRRGNVLEALVSELKTGPPVLQAEAVRALAGRGEREAVHDLISVAENASDSARKAALLALGQLADQEHIPSLVRLVVEAKDETFRGQARDALSSACLRLRRLGIKVDGGPIVSALAAADSSTRAALLGAASAVADGRIRAALRSALGDKDEVVREAAEDAVFETCDPELLPDLLNLAEQALDFGRRIRAIRGYVRLTMDAELAPLEPIERVKALRQILPLTRPEEKWIMLAGLAKLPDPQALDLALPMLDDPATQAEAARALAAIAAGLADTHPDLALSALQNVLAIASESDLRQEATAVLQRIESRESAVSSVTFRRLKIDGKFRSEGVAVADFNRDGRLDIATGNILYLAPDWRPQAMLDAPKEYKPEGYSDEFLCFGEEIDGDGWTDLIVVGFPGAKTRWLRNPGPKGGPWKEFLAIEKTGNESPDWVDVDKDGRKELIFVAEQGVAFARPAADPTGLWSIRVVAGPGDPRPGHGLGVGDINGDGRNDALCPEGFWEAPADSGALPWTFHKAKLGFEAPAQMVVLDVDGDGDADVASSGAHRYGLWWYEQSKEGWKPHEVDSTISQLHALSAADLNKDGLPDLVTGKRFWAHREGDDGIDDPAVVCWFELRRDAGRPSWLRHEIDSDSGVGLHFQTVDVDGDGRLDIVTSNKKGVYLFLQRPASGQ